MKRKLSGKLTERVARRHGLHQHIDRRSISLEARVQGKSGASPPIFPKRPCMDRSPPLKKFRGRAGFASPPCGPLTPLFCYLRYTSVSSLCRSPQNLHETSRLHFHSRTASAIHSLFCCNLASPATVHVSKPKAIHHPLLRTLCNILRLDSANSLNLHTHQHVCRSRFPPYNQRRRAPGALQLLQFRQQRCARHPDGFAG